uniref:hypothetical protein n=1 Tax=Yoonia sp. TaxID=2212373 RepID=UPI004048B147
MKAAAKKQQYQWKRQRLLGAQLAQASVPGAGAKMRAAARPTAPELKYFDLNVATSVQNEFWNIIGSLALCSITQGTGNSQRIGRKIRVRGIVLRGKALIGNVPEGSGRYPGPYTMDFLWDKQCNGAVPQVTDIYSTANAQGLPNPLFDDRFKFIKRLARDDPNSPYTLVNTKINCNQVITYDASTGNITDLSTVNLLLTMVTPFDATPT